MFGTALLHYLSLTLIYSEYSISCIVVVLLPHSALLLVIIPNSPRPFASKHAYLQMSDFFLEAPCSAKWLPKYTSSNRPL